MNNNIFKFILTLFSITISLNSFAYVPPSFYILKNLAKKHEKTDSVIFKSKLTFFKKSGEISKTLYETFYFNSKGYAYSQILDEQLNTLKLSDGGTRHYRKWAGNKDLESKRPIFYDLLYVKDFNSIFNHFKELGLSLKTESELYNTRKPIPEKTIEPKTKKIVSENEKENKETIDIQIPNVYEPEPYIYLSRFENKMAFVVGNADPQIQGMQLWVEKDSLFPLRTILSPYEYRTSGYQIYKNVLFPRNIQILKDNILWAKLEVNEVKESIVDNQVSSFFNTKQIVSPDGETEDHLELFYKNVR